MKKLIALLACFCLVNFTACTSKDSKDEEVSTEESATTDDSGDAVVEDGGSGNPDETQAGFVDEPLPDQALGEAAPADIPADESLEAPPADAAPAEGFAAMEEPTPTPAEGFAASEPPPTEAAIDPGGAAIDAPPPETPAETVAEPVAEAPKPPPAPLKKIETVPFKRGGQLLNAVYVARPGDNYKSMATMIYGTADKNKDLKKANPYVKSPKPGDKIYYNSPMRTTDDTKILTYYEEMGKAPETYEAKGDEDFRKVSKDLLGYSGAWKEIYATNEGVESTRGKLPAGTKLRYWKTEVAAAPVAPPTELPQPIAQNNLDTAPPPPPAPDMPPPPPANELPPPTMANTEPPPPPPPADIPPPPPPPMDTAQLPPPPADIPPPPPPEQAAPPPPPVAKKAKIAQEGLDNDTTMALAAGAIIAAGAAGIILVRKRRQKKEMEAAFNETQVG